MKDEPVVDNPMTIEQAIELHDEAGRLEELGELGQAEVLCRKALEVFEREEGEGSPDVANVVYSLGSILEKKGEYEEALACAQRACGIIEPLLPLFEDESGALIFIHGLGLSGTALRQLGRYQEALVPLERAIELAEPFRVEAASAWNNLGVVCKYAGWFERGEKAYAEAMRCAEQAGDEGRMMQATILHNIGGIRHTRGDYAAAEEPARKAWEMRRAMVGDEDLATLADAVAYAGVLDGLERYGESRPIYERALKIYEDRFGPVHFEVAATLHNLGFVQEACGEPEAGVGTLRRALGIKRELLGAEHPEWALTALGLASLLRGRGDFDEARQLAGESLAVFEKRLDPGHPHIGHARSFL